MKILVVGSGGREHAIVWSLVRKGHQVYCAPGNGGIFQQAECVDIEPLNIRELVRFVKKQRFDLTIVGPEAPLVAGLADEMRQHRLAVFGPSAQAATLEGDKAFAKNLMRRYRIPTADFEVFSDFESAVAFVKNRPLPVVIKACGLAAGKGVAVINDYSAANRVLQEYLVDGKLGPAGRKVVIEECLFGEELSIIGLCDGERIRFMVPSQDHKRLLDNNEGPNTGGMGAYAPVPAVTPGVFNQIVEKIFLPLLAGLRAEEIEYRGAIYAGLMLTADGPMVLEFNCRLGDPEAQVILPLFSDDFAEVCLQCATGSLEDVEPVLPTPKEWALCVVAAVKGYPGTYEKGLPISGHLANGEHTLVFHAGTKIIDERFFTDGGRVLGVTGLGSSLVEARDRAYYGMGLIYFPGMHYRRDIGNQGLRRLSKETG